MGQFLHGSAKTTYAIRAELQRSKASAAALARRYGINEKTVRKWRSRPSVEDDAMGPKERRSTVLSALEEAAIVSLRVQARLPLDDVCIALKDVIHICPAQACITACSASRVCRRLIVKSPRGSNPTGSAISISILQSCDTRVERLSSFWRSTAPRRSSSPEFIARRQSLSQPASSRPWSKQYPTKSTQCSPQRRPIRAA
ncbi:hypothetical protein QE435_004867 [Rhizobium sp. SORGH_AS 787]|nr:hypothetical protein [Rhizobium sp. SORGH_AS_0787]